MMMVVCDDCYDMLRYVDSKTYVLCMISTCYVMYVMIVDYVLIIKFYHVLLCLFFVSLPLRCYMCGPLDFWRINMLCNFVEM